LERTRSYEDSSIERSDRLGEQELFEFQWSAVGEITCAKNEGKLIRGIRAYTDDKTELDGVYTVAWTWENVKAFIDSL